MLNGEWELLKMIYDIIPDFIPIPYGFRRYKIGKLATYFYLSEFIDMVVTPALSLSPPPFCITYQLTPLKGYYYRPRSR